MLLGHGSDIYKYKNKIVTDFSSNVWYKGMPENLREHLKDKLSDIVHYPSPDAGELSKEIANLYQLSHQNILPTNGATEAFYLIAQRFSNAKSYVLYPSFSEYEDACKVFNHSIEYLHNSEIESDSLFEEQALIWIGNPNNPEGKIISVALIESLCIKNPNSYFIVDEAYADLFCNFESVISLLRQYPNIIIVRSLTKTFVIPGIRLGYIIASQRIVEELKAIKMPWSVNTLAIEAGLFVLSNYKSLLPDTKDIFTQSKAFQNELSKISALSVQSSSGNYFLVKLKRGIAKDLKAYLVENYGLLIRDASNFKGLDESYFRVSIQEEQNNHKLTDAIKAWILTI